MPGFDSAFSVIDSAVKDLGLKTIIALFSGGHDSLLSSYIASQHPLFAGVAYANTLIGAKETRKYIYDTCHRYDWHLEEIKPNLTTYEMLLVRFGYPSPATHNFMYRHLKDRSFDEAISRYARMVGCKRGEVGVVTGVRRWESRKRMLMVQPVKIHKSKKAKTPNRVFLAPCHDFKKDERDQLIAELGLVRNEFADRMRHSYECQCGSNLERDERSRRAEISPVYEELEKLREKMVAAAYEVQQFKLNHGLIDPEDATLDANRLTWGWHIDVPITFEEIEDDDSLCAGCMVKRAPDGTAGIDPDVELLERKQLLSLRSGQRDQVRV